MLNCSTHEVAGVLVITLEEGIELPDDRGASHRELLYKLVQSREDGRFAVDLGKLEFMSSADFGFMISLRKRIGQRNGKLVLFDIDPFIRDTLTSMKLISLFTIAEDLTEALTLLPPGDA
jgi:anti-anti-sigma factor